MVDKVKTMFCWFQIKRKYRKLGVKIKKMGDNYYFIVRTNDRTIHLKIDDKVSLINC